VRRAEVTPSPQKARGDLQIPPSKEHDIRLRVTGDVSENDVIAWCEAQLSAYKQPTEIDVVSD
jgi:hypothetical protein